MIMDTKTLQSPFRPRLLHPNGGKDNLIAINILGTHNLKQSPDWTSNLVLVYFFFILNVGLAREIYSTHTKQGK